MHTFVVNIVHRRRHLCYLILLSAAECWIHLKTFVIYYHQFHHYHHCHHHGSMMLQLMQDISCVDVGDQVAGLQLQTKMIEAYHNYYYFEIG